jgi:hypothetical protein
MPRSGMTAFRPFRRRLLVSSAAAVVLTVGLVAGAVQPGREGRSQSL